MVKRLKVFLFAFLATVLLGGSTRPFTFTIEGTVTDEHGQGIAGVVVPTVYSSHRQKPTGIGYLPPTLHKANSSVSQYQPIIICLRKTDWQQGSTFL